MFKRLSILFLVVMFLMINCSDDDFIPISPDNTPTIPPAKPDIGTLFELEEGSTVSLETDDLDVTFTRVTGDNRCPSNVLCIWQGEEAIELRLHSPGFNNATVKVFIDGLTGDLFTPNRRSLDTLGYLITLVNLDPYPEIPDHPGDPEPGPNVARLLIMKKIDHDFNRSNVIVCDLPPEQLTEDHFVLGDVTVTANGILHMNVSYGGGCGDHYFQVYMSPSAFYKSNPVQANLYIYHEDNDDPCDAWITAEIDVSIVPVIRRHQEIFDKEDVILLNIYEYFEEIPHERKKVLYIPITPLGGN